MSCGFVVAIVGAESTGKTALARALGESLAATLHSQGQRVAVVGEVLREFCDARSRTPTRDEQAAIAAEQSLRIEAAAREHAFVVADTTALMTAVYSEHVFGDRALYPAALAEQTGYGLTLLTALDLPWRADGLQRDGPQVRTPVDALLRAALQQAGLGYSVVGGSGSARLQAALAALAAAQRAPAQEPSARARWNWVCPHCDDGSCERHLLARG